MVYAFGNLALLARADERDAQVSQAMRTAWVAFARTGDPGTVLHEWRPYDPARDSYLEFGDVLRRGSGWRGPQLAFLDRFMGEPLAFGEPRPALAD